MTAKNAYGRMTLRTREKEISIFFHVKRNIIMLTMFFFYFGTKWISVLCKNRRSFLTKKNIFFSLQVSGKMFEKRFILSLKLEGICDP